LSSSEPVDCSGVESELVVDLLQRVHDPLHCLCTSFLLCIVCGMLGLDVFLDLVLDEVL
jgi:hypothetical protein